MLRHVVAFIGPAREPPGFHRGMRAPFPFPGNGQGGVLRPLLLPCFKRLYGNVTKTFKYRLYPTKEQRRLLAQ
jgi:hypothetical protein